MSTASVSRALDPRRRRIVFRCWHRGTREMDLLLGRFADAHVAAMGEDELARLESLLEAPDPELFAWISGGRDVPREHDADLLGSIRDFHMNFPTAEDVFRP